MSVMYFSLSDSKKLVEATAAVAVPPLPGFRLVYATSGEAPAYTKSPVGAGLPAKVVKR
jgi:hypothetical protein